MKKLMVIFLLYSLAFRAMSQGTNKLSLNVSARLVYNESVLFGIGSGLQVSYNNKTKFKPLLEISRDMFPSYKKLLVDSLGNPVNISLTRNTNILVGSSYALSPATFASISMGLGFENKKPYPAINLAAGTYLFNNQRWMLKLAYLHIFDKGKFKYQFSTLSLGIGFRIF